MNGADIERIHFNCGKGKGAIRLVHVPTGMCVESSTGDEPVQRVHDRLWAELQHKVSPVSEAEWLACNDTAAMLGWLRQQRTSERKLRLFCVACCHHSLQCMVDNQGRKAVEVAELYADGVATEEELRTARLAVTVEKGVSRAFAGWASDMPANPEAICRVQRPTWVDHGSLLRCIFGNPFRPVDIKPSLLTDSVIKVAKGIYDERAWDRMPVLADAVEEAGATDRKLLEHLRSEGPHYRGCWALDCVLGRG